MCTDFATWQLSNEPFTSCVVKRCEKYHKLQCVVDKRIAELSGEGTMNDNMRDYFERKYGNNGSFNDTDHSQLELQHDYMFVIPELIKWNEDRKVEMIQLLESKLGREKAESFLFREEFHYEGEYPVGSVDEYMKEVGDCPVTNLYKYKHRFDMNLFGLQFVEAELTSAEHDNDEDILGKVYRFMGLLFASASHCKLDMATVPRYVDWHVQEYDGLETVG